MSEMLYIAHPIDLGDSPQLRATLEGVSRELDRREVASFWPGRPYGQPTQAKEKVMAINAAALSAAAGVLAVLPPGVPSVGTPIEIMRARERVCPVAALGGDGSIMLHELGVRTFGLEDVEPAVEWVVEHMRAHPPGRRLRWMGASECCPQRFHEGDAGFDLVVAHPVAVKPGEFVDVDCGIRVELPAGVWAMITGRSSTLRKRKLLVAQGIIDQGYRGPLYAGVWNLGEKINHVSRGERLAQLIPFPLTAAGLRLLEVDALGDSSRGEAGFGSTGVWAG